MEDKIDLRWRKSSYSGNGGGNCVEVAADGRILVRDSQDRAGTVLRFPPAAWRRFAVRVKRSLALGQPSCWRRCKRYPGRAAQSPGLRSITHCGMHVRVMPVMRRMVQGNQRSWNSRAKARSGRVARYVRCHWAARVDSSQMTWMWRGQQPASSYPP
jgi:hypothetical protein